MKRIIFTNKQIVIIFLLITNTLLGFSQGLVVQLGAEKTVAGTQLSFASGMENKKQWSVGGFYQVDARALTQEGYTPSRQSLYGVFLQVPVARCEKLALFANLRTGLVDNKFLVVIPSVETRYSISPRTGFGIGSGIRMGHPSVFGRFFVKMF
jgi:hypothetical protein